jgi:hypothetical protein
MAQTTNTDIAGQESFIAPHPGSQAMPRWDTGERVDAPQSQWRNLAAAWIAPPRR